MPTPQQQLNAIDAALIAAQWRYLHAKWLENEQP